MTELSPGKALVATARFAAMQAGAHPDQADCRPWLVISTVLLVQQAAAIALRAAGDHIPAQSGATELLLRAASKDRLPPPFTLPLSSAARTGFDRLVEARNAFMHPKALTWHLSDQTLALGLPAATASVRHLILVQPVTPGLIDPSDSPGLVDALDHIDALAGFLASPD